MQATAIDDIMVTSEVGIPGTPNNVIYVNDCYAMSHMHTMMHSSLYTIHCIASARWLINEEKYLEYRSIIAFNVNLLLDALSEKNVGKTSARASATHVKRYHSWLSLTKHVHHQPQICG